MNRRWYLLSGAMLVVSAVTFAQGGGQAPAGPPPAPVGLAEGLRRAYATLRRI